VRIGIGLPAAVPGAETTTLGPWAADSERAGFDAVGVFDRLVYDNLEPLVALTVAAARTERVEQVSGGRVTAGLGWAGGRVSART
jgi:alkanesulfonate monooxygenase SsuD/methylene tetrahydromethanopterin reductase-like flavin-dependent oxidoreductase (luciferase family)